MRTVCVFMITGVLCMPFALEASSNPQDAPAPGTTILATSPASLAMDLSRGRPVIQVTIDGKGPFDFIVDTGAGLSIIDDGIAGQLGLEEVGRQVLRSPGSPEAVQGRRVLVQSLESGPLRIDEPVLATMDLAGLTAGTIDGVLGRRHFNDLLLTFDFPASRIVIERGTLDPDRPGVIAMDATAGTIRVRVEVAGQSFPMDIDSGSPGGFTLPEEQGRELPLKGEPQPGPTIHLAGGAHESWNAELDGVIELGNLRYVDPPIILTTFASGFGNIGFQVLRELRMTVDQASGLVALVRPATSKPETRSPTTAGPVAAGSREGPPRLGVRFGMTPDGFVKERGGLVVEDVESGGAADSAGLRSGDILVMVAGTPVADIAGPAELGALLRTPRPLELVVFRGEQRVTVVVP